MNGHDWTQHEVDAIVDDYLSMLASELAGTPYNKAAHRRALKARLNSRSEQAIEFKHANISAALLDAGFPYITGYKPRSNYQSLLADVLAQRLSMSPELHEVATADVDRPMVVPEVDDILGILTEAPEPPRVGTRVAEPPPIRLTTNYIEREARNRSLGNAGEQFVLNYERARLIHSGKEDLAARIEHTSVVRGDHEGYDILSFETSGAERLIEVKATKYGARTPFFVTRNEVATSEREAIRYQVYRLYEFRRSPRLYQVPGAISHSCRLSPASYLAFPQLLLGRN
ncbi:hypothetical protein GPROT2_00465 [Gammaproteobacteria bacterium]|nr:hypothetical protein GPROT2_00465 [Gammaproteobacteria bacterium]